jgi:hypothetical protein
MSRLQAALLGGSALLALTAAAQAQTPPIYDPQQLPAQRGQVLQFTLTPRGDIDGLILVDGTEVKTPPHLSTQLAYAIRPGDTVTIRGLHAAALPLQAVAITDEATGRTVIDTGPPGPGRGPGGPPTLPGIAASVNGPLPGLTEVQSRVRFPLHGPKGDVNGALLEDGSVLRIPPPEAYRFASLLQPGQTIVAEGTQLITVLGKVMNVQQVGASREQLTVVQTPPAPGPDRGRRPPPPGFGPPRP